MLGYALTSIVLGSKGSSEGRSIRGLSSGTGRGAGAVGRQGKGGPSLGAPPVDGDFLMDGSRLGAMVWLCDVFPPFSLSLSLVYLSLTIFLPSLFLFLLLV